jgi:biotin carboxylase
MFTVDKEKKTLETLDKSGCCWHLTERDRVVNDRPVKVFEEVEDATVADETKVKVTTKTLLNGKWRTSVKYVKREQ